MILRTFTFSRPRRLALMLSGLLMTSGCDEPKPMTDFITHTLAQTGSEPISLPPLVVYKAVPYQAGQKRNPFKLADSASFTDAQAIEISSIGTDCESHAVSELPALSLQATFNETHGRSKAMAMIQVAQAEVYTVKLGQRLVAKIDPPTGDAVTTDLGEVIAITSQSVTLKPPFHLESHCSQSKSTLLTLY